MKIINPYVHKAYADAAQHNFNAALKPKEKKLEPQIVKQNPQEFVSRFYEEEYSTYNILEKAAAGIAIPAPDRVNLKDKFNQRVQNAVHWIFQTFIAVTMSLGGKVAAMGSFAFAYQRMYANLYKGIKTEVLSTSYKAEPKALEKERSRHFFSAATYAIILVTSLINGALSYTVCHAITLVSSVPEIKQAIQERNLVKTAEKVAKLSHLGLFFVINSPDTTIKTVVAGLKILELALQLYQIKTEKKDMELKIGPATSKSVLLGIRVAKAAQFTLSHYNRF